LMPWLRGSSKKVSIDYVGAVLLVVGTVPVLLGFTWAGTQYEWLSPQVIGLFSAALVALTAFVFYEARLERLGGQPIIEPSLFKNSIFTVSTIITVIFGMAMFGSIFFIPLFVQGVVGTSATNSGLILTPLMLTLIVGSVLSGQLVSRLGRYKWIAITGMVVSVAGSLLLLRLGVNSTNNDVLIAMLVLGLGMGFGMALYNLIVQNAMPQKIGQATSALVFFRSIGGTIGLAAMGSLMTSAYLPAFKSALSNSLGKLQLPPAILQPVQARFVAIFNNPQILLSPDALSKMHAAAAAQGQQGLVVFNIAIDAVKIGLAQGIHNVFILSTGLMIAGLIAVFFLKEIPLRGKPTVEETVVEAMEDVAPEGDLAAIL